MSMRITGLASGIDIDSLMKDIMRAERIPLNKLEQEKTLLEWKRDAYREANTSFLAFDQKLLNMRLTSYYRTRTVTSTNESLVTAIAANGAGEGTYTITNIKQLAKAANIFGTNSISASNNQKVNLNGSLYSTAVQNNLKGNIDWKTGSVYSKSLSTKAGQKKYSLNLAEGQAIKSENDITVKVNGKKYEVVTDSEHLGAGKVLVNLEDGTLQFSDDVGTNAAVKVDYVTDYRVESRSVTRDNMTMSIGGALEEESVTLKFDFTKPDGTTTVAIELTDNGSGEFLDSEGNLLAKVDYETGRVTFEQSFFDTYLPMTEADEEALESSEEKPKLDIKVTSRQKYFSFDMATHTSNGRTEETFFVQGTESLNQVMRRVNDSDLGVMMFYDEFTDKISLTRTETGDFNENGSDILIEEGFLTDVLGFAKITDDTQDFSGTNYTDGQNAIFNINGLTTERTSNSFTMNGVTFTLNRTTTSETETVTLNVNNNDEKLFENIISFIDQYNELIENIEKRLNETKYRDYKPLTDDEREVLTDKQQEQWEEKARSGLLRNDDLLSGLITKMRTALYSAVDQEDLDPAMRTLSSIGITTVDYTSAKLVVDEQKLREAIAKDPQSIELLFRGAGETYGQKGVVQRLNDIVKDGMDQIKNRAGAANLQNHQFALGRQLTSLEDRIDRFEDRLARLEDRYYRQFSLMERAIQRSNEQYMSLSQFFAN